MKLHAANTGRLNTVTGYGPGYVEINAVRHEGPILLTPQGDIVQWAPPEDSNLIPEHLSSAQSSHPEIVIYGTGPTLRLASPQSLIAFQRAGIGLEAMDTPAACRTYNILMGEGRRVLAALLPC